MTDVSFHVLAPFFFFNSFFSFIRVMMVFNLGVRFGLGFIECL
jgi:hypothetical protein